MRGAGVRLSGARERKQRMHILVTVETKPHHRALLEAAAPQAAFVYKESGVERSDV